MFWKVELAEFSQNSSMAMIKITGESPEGRKCGQIILVSEPMQHRDQPTIFTEWVDESSVPEGAVTLEESNGTH